MRQIGVPTLLRKIAKSPRSYFSFANRGEGKFLRSFIPFFRSFIAFLGGEVSFFTELFGYIVV